MKGFKYTLFGAVISVAVLSVVLLGEIELFERMAAFLHLFEDYQMDEFIIPSFIFLFFVSLDFINHKKQQKIEKEKLKVYKATLNSAHLVINNFLNQMQIFKIAAEDTPNFDPEILKLYDVIIDDAKDQLKALGEIKNIDSKHITDCVSPDKTQLQQAQFNRNSAL